MQPYFFPYLGYFQLAKAVDAFVFYDDVNFIKRGWIHRNRILINEQPSYFTVPCKKVSQNKLIKDIEHGLDEKAISKMLTSIQMAYAKAPFFEQVFPLVESVLRDSGVVISDIASQSVIQTCNYLGMISPVFMNSSEKFQNQELDRADRLIDITKKLDSLVYINMVGGKELYTKEYFEKQGIELQFLKPTLSEYPQGLDEFIPGLSILDVLMFNSKAKVLDYLTQYEVDG